MNDDNPNYFNDPWQTKEVLDPETESKGYDSIVEMVFEHKLACICHILLTNYTWQQSDIQKLIPFYENIESAVRGKLTKLQANLQPTVFEKLTTKFGLLDLPIYSKCVDSSELVPESISRVYHDPKEFINSGYASEDELYNFTYQTLKEALEPVFTHKEIRNVLKQLITSLMNSQRSDEEIGKEVSRKVAYEFSQAFLETKPNFPNFEERLSGALTNFIGYFAMHTIRSHCYANFGVDGELKIYQRAMYKKAIEDMRSEKSKPSISVKPESSMKQEYSRTHNSSSPSKNRAQVKSEVKDSDDDFCEIIETSTVKETPKRSRSSSNQKKNFEEFKESKDFPEKYMLEDLDKDDLPMNFKSKFRKLVEQNQMLRDEIRDYKELIQLKIAEKRQKME